MSKLSNIYNKVEEGWVGPKELDRQLADFANAYYYAVGRDRTYKAAAIKAGAKESSACQLGYRWSKYTVVQRYWQDLQEMQSADRQSLFLSAMRGLEELGYSDEATVSEKREIFAELAKYTANMPLPNNNLAYDDSKNNTPKEVTSDDESVTNTLNQVILSMSKILSERQDDEEVSE